MNIPRNLPGDRGYRGLGLGIVFIVKYVSTMLPNLGQVVHTIHNPRVLPLPVSPDASIYFSLVQTQHMSPSLTTASWAPARWERIWTSRWRSDKVCSAATVVVVASAACCFLQHAYPLEPRTNCIESRGSSKPRNRTRGCHKLTETRAMMPYVWVLYLVY